jgi:hypothetical protein
MTRGHHGERDPKPDLVDWWMGESAYVPPPTPSRQRRFVRALLAVSAVAVTLALAKYAIDVLAILVVLTAFFVALHIVRRRVEWSKARSPGWVWLAVIAVVVALFVAFPVVKSGGASALSRYVPEAITDFLVWSQSHGWGNLALFR